MTKQRDNMGGGNIRNRLIVWGSLALLFVFFRMGNAADFGEAVRMIPAECATVTRVEGTPMLVVSDSRQRPVVSGESLGAGSRIQTGASARVELAFSDGSIIRTAGDTIIGLGTRAATGENQGKTFQAMLYQGRIWVNLSRQSGGGSFQVLAANAMFYGPGSVFATVVYPEGGVEVKSYAGQVTAVGPFEIVPENAHYKVRTPAGENGSTAPESWRHQIEPYRKLIVLASGEATKPFRFASKAGLTDWVRWNLERDGE